MKNGIGRKLIFLSAAVLAPILIASSCVPSKQERDVRGEFATELWEMVVSKEPPQTMTGVAEGENTLIAFRDKSLGKPLSKPPEVSGG